MERVKDEEMESTQTLVTTREVIVTNVVADVRGFCSMSQTEESYQVHVYGMSRHDEFTERKPGPSPSYAEANLSHSSGMLH